jgi:hypothetical protein
VADAPQAREDFQGNMGPELCDRLDDPRNDQVDVGCIHVVGDREGAVSHRLGPAYQFKRDQLSIAEYGVSMQINHLKKIQEYEEKCKAPVKNCLQIFRQISI